MNITVHYQNKPYRVDLSRPKDISLPVKTGGVKAWYVPEPVFEPVRMGDWVGDVKQGGSVNFRNILFNPHGHGTHTECVGHISTEDYSINQCIHEFHFFAQVITVHPEIIEDDLVITPNCLADLQQDPSLKAIIIRTDDGHKKTPDANYSNTNPPYLHRDATTVLIQKGYDHILIDTPSVDRESDGGALTAHHIIWEYPQHTKTFRTITELVFVPDEIKDGIYLLNLQVAPFEHDAAPSRPLLFELQQTEQI